MTASASRLSDASPRGIQIGAVLCGKYQILRELGIGGMSVVWVALDRVLEVEVALKLIERAASDPDDFKRRALTEARLAARLVHPAVCRAVDFGLTEDGDPFVVSELLNGESMDWLLERDGRMSAPGAVRVLLPILDALEAAHEAGILHRDVKPGNLFLARVGPRIQPKLLDFGVACLLEDRQRTKASGRICGTPAYMSPEQARGEKDLDGRSDVWGLCATLYELVTGTSPFDGDSCNAVLWAVQTVRPPPITDFGVGDSALAKIIARGLAPDRSARWATAADLGRELARWLLSVGEETDATGYSLRARLVEPLAEADEHSGLTDPTAVLPSALAGVVPASARALSTGGSRRFTRTVGMSALVVALIGFAGWHGLRTPADHGIPLASAATPLPAARAASPAQGASPLRVPFAEPPVPVAVAASAVPRSLSSAASPRTAKRERPSAASSSRPAEPPAAASSKLSSRSQPVAGDAPRSAPRKSTNALHFDFGL